MSDDLVKRLRATCSCNIDNTPCLAEEECRVAQEAADRIEKLEVKMKWADEISNIQAARLEKLEKERAARIDPDYVQGLVDLAEPMLSDALGAAEGEIATLQARLAEVEAALEPADPLSDPRVKALVEAANELAYRAGNVFDSEYVNTRHLEGSLYYYKANRKSIETYRKALAALEGGKDE